MPLSEDPAYYLDPANAGLPGRRSMADIVAEGNGPADVAKLVNEHESDYVARHTRVPFTPHLFYNHSGVLTEINYGSTGTIAREGWYVDDGLYVRGVMMLRVGTDATLGTAGDYLTYGLPVAADPNLGNHDAVQIGSATIGCLLTKHKLVNAHLGNGSVYNIGTHGYFADPMCDFGIMPNNASVFYSSGTPRTTWNVGVIAPTGALLTGWNNFHIHFGYFKA